jgi:hypothetical protein
MNNVKSLSRSEAFEACRHWSPESVRRLRASARLSGRGSARDPSGQRSWVAVRTLSGVPRASRSEGLFTDSRVQTMETRSTRSVGCGSAFPASERSRRTYGLAGSMSTAMPRHLP